MKLKTLTALFAFSATAAFAQVDVKDAWARATVPGQKATGAFMKLTAKDGSKLVSASSPAAGVTEVHEMKMEGDVMKMAELKDGLEIPAGAKVELKPGGFHIMFMGLKEGIKEGDAVKVKLVFEKAGEVEVEMPAQAADAKAMHHGG